MKVGLIGINSQFIHSNLALFYLREELPSDFEIDPKKQTDLAKNEKLVWVTPDEPRTMYPEFFRPDALTPPAGVTFYSTDDR